jgi:hypothetical protein
MYTYYDAQAGEKAKENYSSNLISRRPGATQFTPGHQLMAACHQLSALGDSARGRSFPEEYEQL